jgi:type III pantothenate kinase
VILCLDCGNSRLKWGLRDGGVWRDGGALPLTAPALPAMAAVDRIIACNVAGEAGRQAVETKTAHLAVNVEWVRSQETQCGITNGYEAPAQLGADRWAALIGARALHSGPCLAVMSGTATTVDVLDRGGRFTGGLILPGLALMREALVDGAADLPAVAGVYRDLPRNTFDAIASGCLQATLGAIDRLFRVFAGEVDALCLLSGGAAPALMPHLDLPHRQVDNLVLEGLARIAAGD